MLQSRFCPNSALQITQCHFPESWEERGTRPRESVSQLWRGSHREAVQGPRGLTGDSPVCWAPRMPFEACPPFSAPWPWGLETFLLISPRSCPWLLANTLHIWYLCIWATGILVHKQSPEGLVKPRNLVHTLRFGSRTSGIRPKILLF